MSSLSVVKTSDVERSLAIAMELAQTKRFLAAGSHVNRAIQLAVALPSAECSADVTGGIADVAFFLCLMEDIALGRAS